MQVNPADIDFTRVAEMGDDLLRRMNELREVEAIAWSDSLHSWVVSRHEDVLDGFNERVPLSCVRFHRCYDHIPPEQRQKLLPIMTSSVSNWVLNSDPPRHPRIRKLMSAAFSRKVVEGIRPFVRDTVASVLDAAGRRGTVEFVNGVARAVTGRVIMKIIGIPEENLPRLERWSYTLNVGFGSAHAPLEILVQTEQSLAEMGALFEEQIALRRAAPQDDFLSALIEARDGADQLSTEELIGILYVTLIAGHDTTMNTMTLGTAALAAAPGARAQLLDPSRDLTSFLMELMRYVAMSTAFPRFAAADFEWRGKQIREGDAVFLMIAGANRDPRVFADPEAIDPDQNPAADVLSFGAGRHHCVGHLLAKMQLGEMLPELFRRFEVEVLDEKLQFAPQLSQRGLEKLNVKFSQRPTN